jgi:tellurite methyltransferase
LDLAGGSGRHAIYLADQGLDVTCVDVSEAALELCEVEASKAGVVVRTVVLDLKTSAPPPGPWDLILVTNYWQPSLFAHFATLLAPGGCLAYSQPTWTNLERNPRPGRRFLAAPGQLETLAEDAGLAVLRCEEGWQSGRHESHLVAQRSAG